MRKYLASLPNQSHTHKKRFAFLASGSFTLVIFAFWAVANFGMLEPKESALARQDKIDEVTPFEAVESNLATPFEAVKREWGKILDNLKNIDPSSEYNQIRSEALNSYGR